MRADKETIFGLLKKQGVLPLMSHADKDVCLKLLKASYQAGIRIFEFACRYDNAADVFTALKEYADRYMPELVLGTGTMMNKADAGLYLSLGSDFIVSPIIDEETGKFCVSENVFWCPGAGTLTEIVHAHRLGADLVKIFPAETLGGAAFVKAIKAPCPWLKLMPTGGVTLEENNLKNWFASGVVCVGIGSALYSKELTVGTEEEMTAVVGTLMDTIEKVRG